MAPPAARGPARRTTGKVGGQADGQLAAPSCLHRVTSLWSDSAMRHAAAPAVTASHTQANNRALTPGQGVTQVLEQLQHADPVGRRWPNTLSAERANLGTLVTA